MKLDELRTLIVAIDTSTDMLSCAVAWWTPEVFFDDRPSRASVEVLSSHDHLCRRRANVELVQTVREALDEAGMSMSDVGGFLVGRGPGSFTGVRIGISTAKGLARGANVPLMGTSTLDACAWTAWKAGTRGLVGVAADAMRGEVYPALYTLDDEGPHRMFERERVVKAAVAVEEWAERADAGELQLTGDGLVRYGKLFEEAGLMARALRANCGGPRVRVCCWPLHAPKAWPLRAARTRRRCCRCTRAFPMPRRTSVVVWAWRRA